MVELLCALALGDLGLELGGAVFNAAFERVVRPAKLIFHLLPACGLAAGVAANHRGTEYGDDDEKGRQAQRPLYEQQMPVGIESGVLDAEGSGGRPCDATNG